MKTTIYTAIGRLCHSTDKTGASCLSIELNHRKYSVDIQELVVWGALCWQILTMEEIRTKYNAYIDQIPSERRTLEDCVARLQTRGLIACGEAENGREALYALLSELYIVPVPEKLTLRLAAFWKLLLYYGIPIRGMNELLRRDRRDASEKQIMELAHQAILSTAELIKCVETGASDISTEVKLLEAIYDEQNATSDNLPDLMRGAVCRENVMVAVSNLYLRKQIVFERV